MVLNRFRSRAEHSSGDGWPTSRRGWRQWLDSTGRLDSRTLANQVHELVYALDRREMPADKRIELLERVQSPIRRSLDYLADRVHSQPLPLPESAQAAYGMLLDLLSGLARAHESAFRDTRDVPRRLAAVACERALALHGERMLCVMQTYASLGDDFWQRVNRVYRVAEMAGVENRSVSTGELEASTKRDETAAGMYKHILLFSLAGAHGLRRDELGRLYRALWKWSELATLQEPSDDENTGLPRFAIELDKGEPPSVLARKVEDETVRILDVSHLVIEVERLREHSSVERKAVPADDEVGHATLVALLDHWMPGTYERSRRAHRGSEVDAEVSLAGIHARITEENRPKRHDPRERLDPPPEWDLAPMAESEMAIARNAGGIRPGVNWNEHVEGQEEAPDLAAVPRTSAQTGHSRWILEDVSATGFRLIWDGEGSCRVAVGEVVALRTTSGDEIQHRWCVGVVRRMRFLDEHRFEIGVEAIARVVRPVHLDRLPAKRNLKKRRSEEHWEPALLIPTSRGSGEPATLLVPSLAWHEGDRIDLRINKKRARFVLGALMEDSGTISRFPLKKEPERGQQVDRRTRLTPSS